LRVRSGCSKALLPTTCLGRASVIPNTNFPPPQFAKAQQHLVASPKSKRFFASLNWIFSPSLASSSSSTVIDSYNRNHSRVILFSNSNTIHQLRAQINSVNQQILYVFSVIAYYLRSILIFQPLTYPTPLSSRN